MNREKIRGLASKLYGFAMFCDDNGDAQRASDIYDFSDLVLATTRDQDQGKIDADCRLAEELLQSFGHSDQLQSTALSALRLAKCMRAVNNQPLVDQIKRSIKTLRGYAAACVDAGREHEAADIYGFANAVSEAVAYARWEGKHKLAEAKLAEANTYEFEPFEIKSLKDPLIRWVVNIINCCEGSNA